MPITSGRARPNVKRPQRKTGAGLRARSGFATTSARKVRRGWPTAQCPRQGLVRWAPIRYRIGAHRTSPWRGHCAVGHPRLTFRADVVAKPERALKPAPVFRCGRFTFGLARPLVMGILNVTPDSFSDGGRYLDRERALAHARQMRDDGADLIDIGGESSRPGASSVAEEDEL